MLTCMRQITSKQGKRFLMQTSAVLVSITSVCEHCRANVSVDETHYANGSAGVHCCAQECASMQLTPQQCDSDALVRYMNKAAGYRSCSSQLCAHRYLVRVLYRRASARRKKLNVSILGHITDILAIRNPQLVHSLVAPSARGEFTWS